MTQPAKKPKTGNRFTWHITTEQLRGQRVDNPRLDPVVPHRQLVGLHEDELNLFRDVVLVLREVSVPRAVDDGPVLVPVVSGVQQDPVPVNAHLWLSPLDPLRRRSAQR